MSLALPRPAAAYDPSNEAQARAAIETADALNVKTNRAVDRLLLRAPDGSVWRLSVSTTGTLVVSAG